MFECGADGSFANIPLASEHGLCILPIALRQLTSTLRFPQSTYFFSAMQVIARITLHPKFHLRALHHMVFWIDNRKSGIIVAEFAPASIPL